MGQDLATILEPKEKIVWEDVINRKILLFNLFISLAIIGGLSWYAFSKQTFEYTSDGVPATMSGQTIGLWILAIGLFFSLLGFATNWVKRYSITSKRVIIKSGLIGTDFNSIYFTQVRNANVTVGLMDKIFGIGTVNIDTGKIETVSSGSGNNRSTNTRTAYDKLLHISKPYEVYKYFQTTMSGREESLYSGRADKENNPSAYKKG